MPDSDAGLTPEELADMARRPQKSSGDNGSLEEIDPLKAIELDRYRAEKRASAAGVPGFKLRKFVPGDAT
jgi:hypothetical protein